MAKEKILVVDDEPMIRWTLIEALRGWGFEAVEAGTVAAGLAAFEAESLPVVLLDINLPDGSGLDLLAEIKRRQPQAVVIMITANVMVEDTIAALRGGAYDFKPGLTVAEVLQEAGISNQAAIDSVRVVRPGADGTHQVLKADYLAMSSGAAVPMALRAGDTVVVPDAKGYTTSDRELLTIIVIGLLIILLVS